MTSFTADYDLPCWFGKIGIAREPLAHPRAWTVTQHLTFLSLEQQIAITIYPGLVIDGASVPRALWWYASPFSGAHAAAAEIHDGLYRDHWLSRKDSDRIFLEAMLASGVRRGKADAMYASVRGFGSRPWNKGTDRGHFVAVQDINEFVINSGL